MIGKTVCGKCKCNQKTLMVSHKMSRLLLGSIVMIFCFLTTGCKQKADIERENAIIVKAIMDRTSEWAEANRQRDADAVLDLFDNSAEMRHAENGAIFPSYAALAEFVKGWYETTETMEMSWEERRVFPLGTEAATMTGIFKYEAKQKSGEVWTGRNVFTGVFIKRGDSWKLIHGHESTVPSSQTTSSP